MQAELVSYTQAPELQIAIAARACLLDQDYSSIGQQLTQADIERLLTTVIVKGHHSVLEHASFTFAISGVSRVLTHQLVRHRIASFSQLSQQRADASDLAYVVPPEITKQPDLIQEYKRLMTACRDLYQALCESGVSRGSARYVLPSGFETRIVVTMNARSLFNLLSQRECAAEEWEFRQLATLMHRELAQVAPFLFKLAGPSCATSGECPEGDIGANCGRLLHTGSRLTNTKESIAHLVEAMHGV